MKKWCGGGVPADVQEMFDLAVAVMSRSEIFFSQGFSIAQIGTAFLIAAAMADYIGELGGDSAKHAYDGAKVILEIHGLPPGVELVTAKRDQPVEV